MAAGAATETDEAQQEAKNEGESEGKAAGDAKGRAGATEGSATPLADGESPLPLSPRPSSPTPSSSPTLAPPPAPTGAGTSAGAAGAFNTGPEEHAVSRTLRKAVLGDPRVRAEAAPALLMLYHEVHQVEGLDVDVDVGFDKYSVRSGGAGGGGGVAAGL